MKSYDVITVGSGLVDMFILGVAREKNKMLNLPLGMKIPVDMVFSSGGGGINTATCISKLGLKVGFLGKIGLGYNSQVVLNDLKKFKVDFLGVKTKESTGYSIILETNKKHRTILTYKKASDKLKFSEVNLEKLNTKWFHFTSMKGESFKTQEKLTDFATKKGIKISFNPGMNQIKKGGQRFKKILSKTYVLSMNQEEARMLVGENTSSTDLFKKLKKLGPKIVCITNGEKDGGVYDGKYLYRFTPRKVKVVETTGAGDAFVSSFVSGLIKFNDLEKAIKVAIANSESVIQERGTKNGLLNSREASKAVKSDKYEIRKRRI